MSLCRIALLLAGVVGEATDTEAMAMLQTKNRRQASDEARNSHRTWAKEERNSSIARLMQSSTKLLTTKITPDVASFARATIDTIESDAIPAIEDEHKQAVVLLENAYDAFAKILSDVERMQKIVKFAHDAEVTGRSNHLECRGKEQLIFKDSHGCNTTLAELKGIVDENELSMDEVSQEIHSPWCESGIPDALDKAAFSANKRRFLSYVDRKGRVVKAWAEYNAKYPICQNTTKFFHAQVSACDQDQAHYEHLSCDRAGKITEINTAIVEHWASATHNYKIAVNESLVTARDRKAEYKGIAVVKCLLDTIHNVSMAANGKPCDQTKDIGQSLEMVHACHMSETSVAHLTIAPKPLPNAPDAISVAPYPCKTGFDQQAGYTGLSANASARACSVCKGNVGLTGSAAMWASRQNSLLAK